MKGTYQKAIRGAIRPGAPSLLSASLLLGLGNPDKGQPMSNKVSTTIKPEFYQKQWKKRKEAGLGVKPALRKSLGSGGRPCPQGLALFVHNRSFIRGFRCQENQGSMRKSSILN